MKQLEVHTDYALAYSAMARRVSMATAYLQVNNTYAAQTLMNECGEIMRLLESPRIVLCAGDGCSTAGANPEVQPPPSGGRM